MIENQKILTDSLQQELNHTIILQKSSNSLEQPLNKLLFSKKGIQQSITKWKMEQINKNIQKSSFLQSPNLRYSTQGNEFNIFQIQQNKQINFDRTSQRERQQLNLNNQKNVDYQRINYKFLLQSQLEKSKKLINNIKNRRTQNRQIQQILQHLNTSNDKLKVSISKVKDSLSLKQQNINKMQSKIRQLQITNKTKLCLSKHKLNEQQRIYKEILLIENTLHKYRSFIKALSNSMQILNGKKVTKLQNVWIQWQNIIQKLQQNTNIRKI